MTAGVPAIVPIPPDSEEALTLIRALDDDLNERYPGGLIHGINAGDASLRKLAFWVARLDGIAVGCAAMRETETGIGEIKRMFVRPEHRGRGVSRRVLAAIEQAARERGYARLRLETGVRNTEALALYASAGYVPIPRFGEYVDDPRSLCFEKVIVATGSATETSR